MRPHAGKHLTGLRVARHNPSVSGVEFGHGCGCYIQAKPPLRCIRSVAEQAVLGEQRLDVAGELDR